MVYSLVSITGLVPSLFLCGTFSNISVYVRTGPEATDLTPPALSVLALASYRLVDIRHNQLIRLWLNFESLWIKTSTKFINEQGLTAVPWLQNVKRKPGVSH